MGDGRQSRRAVLRVFALACASAAAACTKPRTGPTSANSSPAARRSATSAIPVEPPPVSGGTKPAATADPGVARFVAHGPRDRREVALTFHGSGDPRLADALLRTVESAHASVTIFAVGTWLAEQPTMAARITGAGHELENHTWSHPSLGQLSARQVRAEIIRCRDEIAAHSGHPSRYFRPSAMRTPTDRVLRAAGSAGYRTVVGYDVDTVDYADPGAVAVRRLAATAGPGSIVSMHLGHEGTVAALPEMLRDLRARGLSPVTVSALLRP